jgi:hypothetical protein
LGSHNGWRAQANNNDNHFQSQNSCATQDQIFCGIDGVFFQFQPIPRGALPSLQTKETTSEPHTHQKTAQFSSDYNPLDF